MACQYPGPGGWLANSKKSSESPIQESQGVLTRGFKRLERCVGSEVRREASRGKRVRDRGFEECPNFDYTVAQPLNSPLARFDFIQVECSPNSIAPNLWPPFALQNARTYLAHRFMALAKYLILFVLPILSSTCYLSSVRTGFNISLLIQLHAS